MEEDRDMTKEQQEKNPPVRRRSRSGPSRNRPSPRSKGRSNLRPVRRKPEEQPGATGSRSSSWSSPALALSSATASAGRDASGSPRTAR